MKTNKVQFYPTAESKDLRLDRYLGQQPELQSRSQAEKLIQEQKVFINNQIVKASYRITGQEEITVLIPEPAKQILVPLQKSLEILFEDSDLIVLNKPAGLVVHPSPGHTQDTLVNMLVAHTSDLSMGFSENRPGIVHRLDRDTSGVLVVAKNNLTHQALSEKFQKRDIHRLYHAICFGVPLKTSGQICSYMARHPTDRKRNASVRDMQKKIINLPNQSGPGKWAVTNYRLLQKTHSGLAYFELKLETGRTHQIRVHLSEMGHPIVKDDLYGAGKKINTIKNKEHREILLKFPRFALHATELGFQHPKTRQELHFKVGWPADLKDLIQDLGFTL